MNKRGVLLSCACLFLFLGCSQDQPVAVKHSGSKKVRQPNETHNAPNATVEQKLVKEVEPEEGMEEKNPFLSKEENESFNNKVVRMPLTGLKVSAIFYAPPKSKAIINGGIFKEGDSVDSKEIIKIDAEEVILKDQEGEYSVKIAQILK